MGMRKCENLPQYTVEGIKCNDTAKPFQNNTPTNTSCVNWNQYYTVCAAGEKNPFQGSISFDNIGLAWVAIFQVRFFPVANIWVYNLRHCRLCIFVLKFMEQDLLVC